MDKRSSKILNEASISNPKETLKEKMTIGTFKRWMQHVDKSPNDGYSFTEPPDTLIKNNLSPATPDVEKFPAKIGGTQSSSKD